VSRKNPVNIVFSFFLFVIFRKEAVTIHSAGPSKIPVVAALLRG
jgi:hypothetical protein